MKNIRSAKDLIQNRNILLYRLKDLYDELNNTSKNPFKDKKEKNEIKNNIKNIQDELSGLELIVNEGSKFKSDEFCDFLENLLGLSYDDLEITRMKVTDENDNTLNNLYFISNHLTKKEFIDFISDDKELEEFRKNNTSTIVIDTDYIKPFDNNVMMKEEYRNNKIVKNAIYELIDLYIKEPKLSDDERLKKVIENRFKRNINKSNNITR